MKRLFNRKVALVLFDVCLLSLGYAGSFYLRLGAEVFQIKGDLVFETLLVLLVVSIPIFIYLGLYHAFLRFAGLDTAVAVFSGVTASNLILIGVFFLVFRLNDIPRSVVVINWMSSILLIGGSRLAVRALLQARRESRVGHDVLVFGSVEDSEGLIRDLVQGKREGFRPVGLIDPDPKHKGLWVHGVRVFGGAESVVEAINQLNVEEILFVGNVPSRETVHWILQAIENRHIRLKVIPSLLGSLDEVAMSRVREVRIEDLLRRTPTDLDLTGIRKLIERRPVLVTGAGGSIGSELVLQIASNHPSSLALVEFSEENLNRIRLELQRRFPEVSYVDFLVDATDEPDMAKVFEKVKPELVFHAAAYKHVHLVEENPCRGIINNVDSLRVVANLAIVHEVSTFVFISTDKAVRPVSLMGATKRLGERYIKALNRSNHGMFVSVRFGNVLGSSGSVVPVFRDQILAGGPVTVTDARVTRYFMLPSEAVQLVLQAAAIGEGGKIYVLDMGEPIAIDQMARDMIRLMGFIPEKEIPIIYTGLRPGEKLHEGLAYPGNERPTRDASIFEDIYEHPEALSLDSDSLKELVGYAKAGDTAQALRLLQKIVPGFEPMHPETRQHLVLDSEAGDEGPIPIRDVS